MSNPLIDTLITELWEQEVIVIRRVFVRLTGSLEAAILLDKLLRLTLKNSYPTVEDVFMDGWPRWIARSDQEWAEELMLTQYAVRKARATLQKMGLIETAIHKCDGVPKVHYCLLQNTLQLQLVDFMNSQGA